VPKKSKRKSYYYVIFYYFCPALKSNYHEHYYVESPFFRLAKALVQGIVRVLDLLMAAARLLSLPVFLSITVIFILVTMQGDIFDVKRYAIHDGPGIRTTVFFRGCGLRCAWCHNPESQPAGPLFMRQTSRVGEREHVEEHPVGRLVTVDEVVALVERDVLFYEESGGGVTFSGGEPLLQEDFLVECLERCRERGIHACVDTSGVAPATRLEEICRLADLFLYDLKTMNPVKFKRYAGEGFDLATGNLRRVAASGRGVIIRVPVIPGVNTGREDAREMIAFLEGMPSLGRVQLLPYHRNGVDKYRRLGRAYPMGDTPALTREELEGMAGWFREAGFEVL
jgi:pyruvate formate lyase activating enzyme